MAAPIYEESCLRFNLLELINGDLKKFLETVKKEKVCVISVIGKSALNASQFKEHVIAEALNRHIFQTDEEKRGKSTTKCDVNGYYDVPSRSIFLQMQGINDSDVLLNTCREMEDELKVKSFLEVWSDIHFDYAKILLMLFCISHIIIVVHPTVCFDLSYVYLFRSLETMRLRAVSWFREVLSSTEISNDWLQNGRPCSPRVLFVFQSSSLFHSNDGNSIAADGGSRFKSKKQSPLKRLEHSLEDQIYRILRKSRVITNVSGNSLFAVPANQEFVYIFSSKPYITDFVGFFLTQIRSHCQMASDLDSSESKLKSQPNILKTSSIYENGIFDPSAGSDNSEHSFSKFLFQHINLALSKGFDDNVGRYPVPAYFELASTHIWFETICKLGAAFYTEPKESKGRSFHQSIKAALDTDVKFSEGRCAKVLPLASAAYQDNLPTHYTDDYHQTRLAHALHVFSLHARGPAIQRFAKQLKEDCERLWKSGHQMCEVLSLTGNHCMNPLHRTDDELLEEKTLPIMSHCSQMKILSTCDCGRKQATRDDPFDVKAANYDFYVLQRNLCCRDLERIEFPVFQASTVDSHPARISPIPLPLPNDVEEKSKDVKSAENASHGTNLSKPELSEGNSDENSLINEIEQLTTEDQSQSQAEDERDEIVISIQDETAPSRDRGLTRQPSTTEYLPGMLHSESRPSLLPMFSSWSLVCLGPSSLYSHNIGLQDQPGFIPGTNYLLPWDVTVKLEQKERWPALWEGKRPLSLKAKKAIRDGPQFNVKIFIGVEYECYRGHRFMCSAPDRVLRVTSTGHVKDNASKVTGSDMPLYFPCPCRSSKPQNAQLMRIHVVTPKAPVHVTIHPKVQPAPDPCPVFFPTINEPLKLSQSAYWVLRLPFVYEGEHGPYLPLREPVPVTACRLLKGTYNIAEQQSSR
ncbi:nonsense-mediated mRNA decay factor SMG8-like [Uloborus diversus]|uniref:nonsense-mediated mRNA decay factor SMG8-like n=1 Tax=Uloborus diversus TaxID=327109 RepID=UPI00240A6053|nr:nonsense-mediated mRNA decay factor SMG8-like [Uloborus diversus]